MAGAKGGGAWKVAYADFVTAMMAFFLVMWICGQDQKVRRSVSDYFSNPFGVEDSGSTRKPSRAGSVYETIRTGNVPLEERVALGQGRKPHSLSQLPGRATKLVSDVLFFDKNASDYWQKQARDQRESARWSEEVQKYGASVEKVAVRRLTTQLEEEMTRDLTKKTDGVVRDMLYEIIAQVNWMELAEDLVDR